MTKTTKYQEISAEKVPAKVRFDVPRRCQGQMVEVAYGGFSRGEHGYGDPFMRVTDYSLPPADPGRVTFYKLYKKSR